MTRNPQKLVVVGHQSTESAIGPDFDLFMDQARYLTDYQWRRSGWFETRATQLLAADAVVLALLAGWVLPNVGRPKDGGAPIAGLVLVFIGAPGLGFVTSAAGCVMAIASRMTAAPNMVGFQEAYDAYCDSVKRGQPSVRWQVEQQLVTVLLGSPGERRILAALSGDAGRRSWWLNVGIALFLVSLVFLATAGGLHLTRG